jgi:hypothetical protein
MVKPTKKEYLPAYVAFGNIPFKAETDLNIIERI